jgi:antitoxin (DNA-binding transcriptional repressor) of toxin-antitoxin stability system
MDPVTIGKAKRDLSKPIARAEAGEEVVIARGHAPVARLVSIPAQPKAKRQPGSMKGRATVTAAFFDPLPDGELKLWE